MCLPVHKANKLLFLKIIFLFFINPMLSSYLKSKMKTKVASNEIAAIHYIWGIDEDSKLYVRSGEAVENRDFIHIDGPSNLVYIDKINALGGSMVWGIDKNNEVYYRDNRNIYIASWTKVPGKMSFLRIQNDGKVWAIDDQDFVYVLKDFSGDWQLIPNQKLVYLDITADGRIYGIDRDDNIYTREGINGKWLQIEGKLRFLRATPGGRVWGINSEKRLFTLDGPSGKLEVFNEKFNFLDLGPNGLIWALGLDSCLYVKKGLDGSWYKINDSEKTARFRILENERAWIIKENGDVYTIENEKGSLEKVSMSLRGLWGPDFSRVSQYSSLFIEKLLKN